MSKIWELDFYSRPLFDENKKKVWEVLICESPLDTQLDPETLYKYAQYCPYSTVNSVWLAEAIQKAISEAGEAPQKIRFFRRQMKNMITKACEDIGINASLSRRTYTLNNWLQQRIKEYYPQQENYDIEATTSDTVQYPASNAIALPQAIRGDKGDKWAFVSLEASQFADIKEWEIGFGEAFPLDMMGITPEMQIPGLIFFSNRALPLAGWMSSLEMGLIKLEEKPKAILRLETEISDSWVLANVTNPQTLAEAKAFEIAKQKSHGVHFLAVQSSPTTEAFAGFWLLKE